MSEDLRDRERKNRRRETTGTTVIRARHARKDCPLAFAHALFQRIMLNLRSLRLRQEFPIDADFDIAATTPGLSSEEACAFERQCHFTELSLNVVFGQRPAVCGRTHARCRCV
jgi:hypothetical protein